MPIATTSTHVPYFPENADATILRVGNIVTAYANVVTSSLSVVDSGSVAEKIPSGYRPATGTEAIISLHSVIGVNAGASMSIDSGGNIVWNNGTAISGPTRFIAIGTWFTKDPWPSS